MFTDLSDDGRELVDLSGLAAHQLPAAGVEGGGVAHKQHIAARLLRGLERTLRDEEVADEFVTLLALCARAHNAHFASWLLIIFNSERREVIVFTLEIEQLAILSTTKQLTYDVKFLLRLLDQSIIVT